MKSNEKNVDFEIETETPDFNEPECKEEEARINSDKMFRQKMIVYPKIINYLKEHKNKNNLSEIDLITINKCEKEKVALETMAIEKIRKYILSIITSRYISMMGEVSSHIEDMYQSAIVEILTNLWKYNPQYAFTTFCKPHIWHAIKGYEVNSITNKNSPYYNKIARLIVEAKEKLKLNGNDNPAIWEIADEIGVSSKVVANVLRNELASERVNMEDVVEPSKKIEELPEEYILHKEMQNTLEKLLSYIDDVEKYVVLKRYGCLDGRKYTYKEIGTDPSLIKMIADRFPDIKLSHGKIKVKSKIVETIFLPENAVKKIEKDALTKIRLTDVFNQNEKRVISHETIHITNMDDMNITVNKILTEEINIEDISLDDFM